MDKVSRPVQLFAVPVPLHGVSSTQMYPVQHGQLGKQSAEAKAAEGQRKSCQKADAGHMEQVDIQRDQVSTSE